MSPFRWPKIEHDLMLATEVAARSPKSGTDWETIASILSKAFSTDGNRIELTGRSCRERMDRLLAKHKEDDKKSLKKSGTEEEYTELTQLLEDIMTCRRDMEDLKRKEKEEKNRKEELKNKKGQEMRAAAVSKMCKRKHSNKLESSESSSENDENDENEDAGKNKQRKPVRQRASKLTALEMLTDKYKQKTELKQKELELRRMELDFEKEKYNAEAEERKAKFQLEMEERKAYIALLQTKS
ncbi:stress response protein NST1-like [Dendronephthya gigantea]|uniref:stress response protein NST1-like n=1 Tax=Dendronephthya gigantea TaxID=151771 RepID=UPI00106B9A35|nr:stress response protein NST1-like [Dendronephthya gigantea]